MSPKESSSPIGASDLDFSPLEDRLKSIEQKQMVIIVALVIIAFLILNKK
jgi:hypothetical protein